MTSSYQHKHHASNVIRGLNELREEDQFCDAVLQTSDNQQFPVHKCVLVAASPYFRAMFSGSFSEATRQPRDPIILRGATSAGLEPLLNCLYSGELELTNECVYEAVPIAHMLQIPDVLESCSTHLVKKMSLETCFQSLRLAEKFELLKVQEASEKFLLENFVPLSKRSDFSEMSLSELCRYLGEVNGEEIELFRAAKRWLAFKVDRREDVTQVMALINFNSMSSECLTSEVLQDELITSNKESFKKVLDAVKYHSNLFSQPFHVSDVSRGEDVLVVYEGEMELLKFRKKDILLQNGITQNPKKLQCPCSFLGTTLNLVKIGNFAFLFGLHSDTLAMGAKRFNATTGEWINLAAPPRMDVAGTAVVGMEKAIIMVGGHQVEKNQSLHVVQRLTNKCCLFMVEQNEWKQIACCPTEVTFHSVCSRQKIMYLAGGYTPKQYDTASEKLFAYDVDANLWLCKADMNEARAESVFEAVNDKLFNIGGFTFKDTISSVEMYSIQDNQWTTVLEGLTDINRNGPLSLVDGNQIFVFNGTHVDMFDTERRKYTRAVVNFDRVFSWSVGTVLKM